MDSPSHSPMQPPRSDKNLAKINLRKLVVVTIIVGEKVRLIVELLWVLIYIYINSVLYINNIQ
jgi:hypothetical protein